MSLDNIELIVSDPRLGTSFPLPAYATDGSAGVDLVACIAEQVVLLPNNAPELINTGMKIFIRDPGYAAVILPRSGLGHNKGLVLGSLVGLIDADYQGELKVSAWNRSRDPIFIEPGMKIAQLVFLPVARPGFKIVTEFDDATKRGEGGFGHTGT